MVARFSLYYQSAEKLAQIVLSFPANLDYGANILDFFLKESGKVPICFIDNQSAIAVANSSITTKKSKHFQMGCGRERVNIAVARVLCIFRVLRRLVQ